MQGFSYVAKMESNPQIKIWHFLMYLWYNLHYVFWGNSRTATWQISYGLPNCRWNGSWNV